MRQVTLSLSPSSCWDADARSSSTQGFSTHSQAGSDSTQKHVCPDTTDKRLWEATTLNPMLSLRKQHLSNIPVPKVKWFVIAQNASKSSFVLGTNEVGLSMASEDYQYKNICGVLLLLVGQSLTMRDQTCTKIRRDFPCESLMNHKWMTFFPIDGPTSNIHMARVRVF